MLTSDETITQNSIDEGEEEEDDYNDDENTQTENTNKIEEKEIPRKKSEKFQEKDRLDKSGKYQTLRTLKTDRTCLSNNDEMDSQINQDFQIFKHSNLIYENQDLFKLASKSFSSQVRLKSFEVFESIDQLNQESQKNILSKQKSQQELNKALLNRDSDVMLPKKLEQPQAINQNNKEGSFLNTSNILDKPKHGILQPEQQKNLVKKVGNNSQIKQTSNLAYEEHFQILNQEINQIQQTNKLENNKKASTNILPSHSNKTIFQKSQKHISSSSSQEKANSLGQTLLKILTLLQLHGKNVSSEQFNCGNFNYNQDASNYNLSQNLSILNHSLKKINRQTLKKFSPLENSQKNLKIQTVNDIINKGLSKDDQTAMGGLSKYMLQSSQLPLLLQLTGLSYQNIDTQYLNPMDNFDRIQCFKKFYPENNFDKAIHKLKVLQQQQKKQKKFKLASKERRQNIGLTKISIFQTKDNLIKIIPQDYKINEYKPTYLSYGIKSQQGIIFPISYSKKK